MQPLTPLTCSVNGVSARSASSSAYVRIVFRDRRSDSSLKFWFCPTSLLRDMVTCIFTLAKFCKVIQYFILHYITLWSVYLKKKKSYKHWVIMLYNSQGCVQISEFEWCLREVYIHCRGRSSASSACRGRRWPGIASVRSESCSVSAVSGRGPHTALSPPQTACPETGTINDIVMMVQKLEKSMIILHM